MAAESRIQGGYWRADQENILPPEQIPTQYFTHLFYAFARVDAGNGNVVIDQAEDLLIRRFIDTIHKAKKFALLSIGGPGSADVIAAMARDPGTRLDFIGSTIRVCNKYGFDGLELAWEFPKTNEDMRNFESLIQQWRQKIAQNNYRILLAASVYFAPDISINGAVTISYPASAMNDNLNFINLILYEYSPFATAHAQFFSNQVAVRSSACGIKSWDMAGVQVEKLVMGIPLYGKKWKLPNPQANGVRADITPVPYRNIPGAAEGNYDFVSVSQYLADETSWYGYDGTTSIRKKIQFVTNPNQIGGYFLYSLGDEDDSHTLSEAAFNAWRDE